MHFPYYMNVILNFMIAVHSRNICTFLTMFYFWIVFYLSFVVTPICSNASEIVSSLIFASKRKIVNTSMTYSQVKIITPYTNILLCVSLNQLYGAVTMNNTVCLAAFTGLVYFNELQWHFSAGKYVSLKIVCMDIIQTYYQAVFHVYNSVVVFLLQK